jgi:hypothetical protein
MNNAIKDYIKKIDAEIDRLHQWLEEHISCDACVVSETEGRIKALLDVKADLEGILEET